MQTQITLGERYYINPKVAVSLTIESDDQILVQEYVNNSRQEAFGVLYEKYVGEVYRIAYMKVGNKQWAEEIVSDTFFTLMKVLENFRGDSQLKTFIIGITINKVRQFWSKQQKAGISLDENIINSEPEGEETEVNEADIRFAKDILGRLEQPYKSVLEKRFIDGLSVKETADSLSLSEANVRVIQHRALKKALALANNINNDGEQEQQIQYG